MAFAVFGRFFLIENVKWKIENYCQRCAAAVLSGRQFC